MISEPSRRGEAGRLILAGLVATFVAGGAGIAWWWSAASPETDPKQVVVVPPARRTTHPPIRPAPRSTADYVGSEACAKCHAAIAKTFAEHPMGQSSSPIEESGDLESYGPQTAFKPGGGRQYWVERKGGQVLHHEAMVDDQGETIYDQAAPVKYTIGSGTRGRSYAIDRGGMLFMSPLSWYREGEHWDLSPSYAPESHQRFERRIAAECLLCHTGRLRQKEGQQNVFEDEPFVEIAIGCERCHGPGREHVALQQSAQPPKPDLSIVNPGKLTPELRDSVCNQCHLQGVYRVPRYGRSFSDFRPGELLASCWSTLVEGTGVREDGETKFVSQVQQMTDSACYKGSAGKLGCISCHDPHAKPSESEKEAYYRQQCLSCHAERGCTAPAEERAAPPANDSCVHCHMPPLGSHDVAHASQTDHRVRRLVADADRSDGDLAGEPPGPPEFFGVDDECLEPWESRRAFCIASVQLAAISPTASLNVRATETMLRDVIALAPDDIPAIEALGMLYLMRKNLPEGRRLLERILEIDPRHETALSCLSLACYEQRDFQAGLQYMARLKEVNPWIADDRLRYADMLSQTGHLDEAIQEGVKSLELNPGQKVLRAWLVQAYTQAGDLDAARREAETLERMEARPP